VSTVSASLVNGRLGRVADQSRFANASKYCLTTNNDITTIIDMKTDYSRALPEEWTSMSKVFTALGDEHRQRILLLFEPGERLNVGQIAEVSTLARSTVSHHLKTLREAQVLHSEKVGKEVWFWINREFIEETFLNVLEYVRMLR